MNTRSSETWQRLQNIKGTSTSEGEHGGARAPIGVEETLQGLGALLSSNLEDTLYKSP